MRFTLGQLVVTPTGRIAKVMGGLDGEGRLPLRYQDCGPWVGEQDTPSLFPMLLRAANVPDEL